ncbi:MAG: carbohydrate ABC transporter permease [Spirochaetes bacterium]|nr:MAG: carbohydrate ABC transporter permease [Spirochaetota bacterium]
MEKSAVIDQYKRVSGKPLESKPGHYTLKIILGKPGRIFILVLFLGMILIPILFMITTSLKEPIEIRLSGALFPSQGVTGINWVKAFRNVPLVRYLFNSTVVALVSTFLVVLIAVPATYSIIRFSTGGWFLPAWILGTYVMPPIIVSIPIFNMVKFIGLQNTLAGMILVHTMMNMPIAVWLIDSYIRVIPRELERAAWIDGYSKWETLLRVVFPLIKPGVVATGVICMILSWNDFLFALILTYSVSSNTFPIGISRYVGEHGLQFGEMSAAALAGIIPIYILVFIFSRNLVESLTRGSVKG